MLSSGDAEIEVNAPWSAGLLNILSPISREAVEFHYDRERYDDGPTETFYEGRDH